MSVILNTLTLVTLILDVHCHRKSHTCTQILCTHHAVRLPLCRGGTPLEGSPLCSPISGRVGWEPVGRVAGSPCGREAGAWGHTCGPGIRPDRCTCPQSHSAGTRSPERCTDTAYTTELHCPTNNSAKHTGLWNGRDKYKKYIRKLLYSHWHNEWGMC